MKICFLDTETTGLDREQNDIWEIGVIVRKPDHPDLECQWMIRPDLRTASPEGLRIGRYYQRMGDYATCVQGMAWSSAHPTDHLDMIMDSRNVAAEIAHLLDGATLVGAVIDFDAEMLRRWLRRNHQAATWHYHLVDVETYAAGALGQPPPWHLDELLDEYGLVYDEADRHTALGDARMVRDLYDAVLAAK